MVEQVSETAGTVISSETVVSSEALAVLAVLAELGEVVDRLVGLDLTRLSREELLEVARRFERQQRRLPVVEHAMIGELDRRGVAADLGARDTAALLVGLLRLDPGQARARIRAAAELGARLTLGGQVEAPLFPRLAAAQHAGTVSARAARIITATITAQPDAVADLHAAAVEAFSPTRPTTLDPHQLAAVARRLSDTLNPDGT